MISKNLIQSHQEKNMVRKTSHIKLISAMTAFGLLASQSVYAADEAASGGIPGWVWLLLVVAILVGITLLPKKWIEPKVKDLEQKAPPQAPKPTVPIAKVTETAAEIKPVAPKVEAAPVAEETIDDVLDIIQEAPPAEKPVEVIDALVEAKQLLAQQRFPQAVGVLNKGLQKDPVRSDLMLELLAIYLKQNDHEAFDTQFEQLKQLDDPLALIQAEELHNQLVRPVVVEDSDLIEFDAKQAEIVVSEPEIPTEIPDYSADSLAFTSEKPLVVEPQVPEATSAALDKTVEIKPTETEFSLDDIDLEPTSVETTATPVEVAAEKPSDDFDFSEFDDFVMSAPLENKALDKEAEIKEIAAKEAETVAPVVEVAEIKAPAAETSGLVDLEFDLDDSFSLDEEKVETTAKKADWATELADETFVAPTEPAEPAFKDPFAAEVAPEPVVPVPVAPPKVVEPVAKDLATTLEEEFPFLQTADTFQTRLDLARNYIALGEISSAKELLNEVAAQGDGTQQTEARELIAKLAS